MDIENLKTKFIILKWGSVRERIKNWMPGIFTFAVCLAILLGWRMKGFELITSERGIGYMFGVSGTISMAILFVYSLRKRMPELEVIGTVKTWFRIHMVLGIIGPLFVLFHANFNLGSLNSNVALFSMLIVVFSGIIGRYIYGRIHYGLYGGLANLKELQNDFEQQKEEAGVHFALIPGLKEELFSFAKDLLVPSEALGNSAKRLVVTRCSSFIVFGRIKRISKTYFDEHAVKHNWGFFKKLRMQIRMQRKAAIFIGQAIKVAEFNFYERLFSLWHMLHIPFVFLLFLAVIVHVIAVNRF